MKKAQHKALDIVNKAYDMGKFPKGFSLSDFRIFENCTRDLCNIGRTETINESVKNLLEKCGFSATVCGIGWSLQEASK